MADTDRNQPGRDQQRKDISGRDDQGNMGQSGQPGQPGQRKRSEFDTDLDTEESTGNKGDLDRNRGGQGSNY